MGRKSRFGKDKQKAIALGHIHELFSEAEKVFKKNPSLSDAYVKKAREIQMKFKVRMPQEYKRRFCKHCLKYLVPSVNCRVRIGGRKVIYYCFSCKKFMRFPIQKRK